MISSYIIIILPNKLVNYYLSKKYLINRTYLFLQIQFKLNL